MDELYEIFPKACENDIKQLEEYLASMPSLCEITEWKGHKFGAVFNAETIKYACTQWNVKDGDVIIATYPRTGKTILLAGFTNDLFAKLWQTVISL